MIIPIQITDDKCDKTYDLCLTYLVVGEGVGRVGVGQALGGVDGDVGVGRGVECRRQGPVDIGQQTLPLHLQVDTLPALWRDWRYMYIVSDTEGRYSIWFSTGQCKNYTGCPQISETADF